MKLVITAPFAMHQPQTLQECNTFALPIGS
jgi:hypothetical protein